MILIKSLQRLYKFYNSFKHMINQGSIAEQSQSNINEQPLVYRIKQYKAKSVLSQFSYMLIRPPRFLYNEQLLNPPQNYQIKFKVQQHNIPFKLTLYRVQNMLYVILYLHGNSSSRFEGYMHLKQLPQGVGLACFDFNGCGLRYDSEFITLGKKESAQVDIAAKYLKGLGYKVAGWGRSMGSVSLLLSQECDVMVADSPFYSLSDLCKQSSQKFVPSICCCFFHCLYPCLFSCVRSDVRDKAGFDLQELEIAQLIKNNPRNKQRSLFIMAGIDDNMIHYSHSEKIFESFPGKKKIQLFHGGHNSQRPAKALDNCFLFIETQLGIITPPPKGKNIKLKPIIPQGREPKLTQIKLKKIQHIQINKVHPEQSDLSLMNKPQNQETIQYKTLTVKTSSLDANFTSKISNQTSKISTISTIKEKQPLMEKTQAQKSKNKKQKVQNVLSPVKQTKQIQSNNEVEKKEKKSSSKSSNQQTPSIMLKQ